MRSHEQLLTIQVAAAVLKLHPETLRRAMRRGLVGAAQWKDQPDAC
ncbi:MerR family transcriptional regulator [Acetobacter senegalensis]|nr:hypothetical protein [Acetobacter senegalensis]MDN7354460.1 hypothetical protein [Acetobacter senegalensis]